MSSPSGKSRVATWKDSKKYGVKNTENEVKRYQIRP
uniref:50S ribosomal protein L33 n=1 Tax=Echinococcus granulosus TaxID=6210 RepID=A0A068W6V1_ECHGR|nr:hypothetical protein EgrG_000753800 [Echinococcus granulosus]